MDTHFSVPWLNVDSEFEIIDCVFVPTVYEGFVRQTPEFLQSLLHLCSCALEKSPAARGE